MVFSNLKTQQKFRSHKMVSKISKKDRNSLPLNKTTSDDENTQSEAERVQENEPISNEFHSDIEDEVRQMELVQTTTKILKIHEALDKLSEIVDDEFQQGLSEALSELERAKDCTVTSTAERRKGRGSHQNFYTQFIHFI